MNNELAYITQRFNVDIDQPSPIHIDIELHRVELAKLYSILGYTAGAEIGTATGGYASILTENNRRAAIYCIDPWEVYEDFSIYGVDDSMERNYQKAMIRLSPYKNVRIIRKYSMDALKQFKDRSLDFVYIDANHTLPYIMQDIVGWTRKVRKGGIVAGHDYLEPPLESDKVHVRQAVMEYTEAFDINPWFTIGTTERALSWLWVN